MNSFNDIVSNNYIKPMTMNGSGKAITPEQRTHSQNEELAAYLSEKLSATDSTRELYLAIAYSGIPRSTLERHLATALETGRVPAKLFSFLVCKEPLWLSYKNKKDHSFN